MIGRTSDTWRRLVPALFAGIACAVAGECHAAWRQTGAPPATAVGTAPPEPAAPGKAVEIWVDRRSEVTSAWLANGVLIHHKLLKVEHHAKGGDGNEQEGGPGRRGDRPTPEISVSVTIAGAELLETPENRGISDAAVAAAWTARSVRSMKPGELAAYLATCGASVRGIGGGDSFMLTAAGGADKIDGMLRAMHVMLSEPVIDAEQLQRWQEQTAKQMEDRRQAGISGFAGVIARLFGPQDARARFPSPESIRRITPEAAQAWLDSAVGADPEHKGLPMEVAIVGDISVDRAIRLAEVYFGSLPARERISEATLADRRIATRPPRPPAVIHPPDWKGSPLVLVGFFGADIRDIGDHRALAVAAEVLSNRLNRLPAEQNEGNRAGARAAPGMVYPGFGLFLATTHAKEGNEGGACENIAKLLLDMMDHGPSAEELETATKSLSKSAGKMLSDPYYWAWMLSHSSYQGVRIGDIGIAEKAYLEITPERITAAIKKYWTPERSIKLIVKQGEAGKDGAVEQ